MVFYVVPGTREKTLKANRGRRYFCDIEILGMKRNKKLTNSSEYAQSSIKELKLYLVIFPTRQAPIIKGLFHYPAQEIVNNIETLNA